MASRTPLAPLLRSMSLAGSPPCACTCLSTLPRLSSRSLSTAPAYALQRQNGVDPRTRATGQLTTTRCGYTARSAPRTRLSSAPSSSSPSSRPPQTAYTSHLRSYSTAPSPFAPLSSASETRQRSSTTGKPAQRDASAIRLRRLAGRREEKMAARAAREAEAWERISGTGSGAEDAAVRETGPAREARTVRRALGELGPPSGSKKGKGKAATDQAPALPAWKTQQLALRAKFPSGWAPPKRLSREAMDLVRSLARADPAQYTTAALAERFRISPEAVRRILKSRWEMGGEERERRERRRREAREREVKEGGGGWGGDVAAERREMERLRKTGVGSAQGR